MKLVCQQNLPFAPWLHKATRRLPGVGPLDMADWLVRDDAFAGQMALRDDLLRTRQDEVFQAEAGAQDAAEELLALVLSHLGPGYSRTGTTVIRPDGGEVDLITDHPLLTAGRLVQEDLCLLDQRNGEGEHVLTAAVLCFPASWTLSEKIGRPLSAIHVPVDSYDAIAPRVQRMFDVLHVDRPLWRANALRYDDPALFQPRKHGDARVRPTQSPAFLRSERQCLLRLPKSRAVVFSIHTWLVEWHNLSEDQRAGLDAYPIDTVEGRG